MLHGNEVGLATAGKRPTVVYISSSSATGNRDRLVQAFWSQTLSALRVEAASCGNRLPVETMLLLDEFASLGKVERRDHAPPAHQPRRADALVGQGHRHARHTRRLDARPAEQGRHRGLPRARAGPDVARGRARHDGGRARRRRGSLHNAATCLGRHHSRIER